MSSSFKDRYDNDVEFKKRHLNYIKEKIVCQCGKTVARSNLSGHRKTQVHLDAFKSKSSHEEEINEITKKYIEALNVLTNKKIKNVILE